MIKTRMYVHDPTQTLTKKLTIVKAVKVLTGLGLKESKDLCDELFELNLPENRGKYVKDYVELEIIYKDKETIDNLLEVNVMVGNLAQIRENSMDDLLKIFEVILIRRDMKYVILDGSYDIVDNLVIVDIKEGKCVIADVVHTREIKDVILKLSLSEVIIEEHS